MEVYSINRENVFKNATHILLFAFAFLIGVSYVLLNPVDDKAIYVAVFSGFFFIQFSVWAIIHFNYYNTNKDDELIYNENSNIEFKFVHGTDAVEFGVNDIEKVTYYKSCALHKGNIKVFACDEYNHAIIELLDGKKIVITSLLTGGEVTIPVNDDKVRIKLNLIRWVSGESLRF